MEAEYVAGKRVHSVKNNSVFSTYALAQRVSLLLLLTALFFSFVYAVSIGAVYLNRTEIFCIILEKISGHSFNTAITDTSRDIVLNIRLPRVILAGLVGAALAVAGATFQGLFRNPLADPYIIGVSSGAALGASFAIVSGISWGLPASGGSNYGFCRGTGRYFACLPFIADGQPGSGDDATSGRYCSERFLSALVSLLSILRGKKCIRLFLDDGGLKGVDGAI